MSVKLAANDVVVSLVADFFKVGQLTLVGGVVVTSYDQVDPLKVELKFATAVFAFAYERLLNGFTFVEVMTNPRRMFTLLLEKFVTTVELLEVSVAFKATVKLDSESGVEDILFGAERTFSAL